MSSKLLLALAAATAAQTTTVEVFAPMLEGGLHATVISIDGATTTLGITCPEGATSDECGLPGPDLFTHIAAPSTMSYHYENDREQYLMDGNCDLSSDEALCTGFLTVRGESSSGIETIEDYKTWMNTVTVTAGAEKLTASGDGPTETSEDGPSETGAQGDEDEGEGGGEDGEGDDGENGAAGLASSSLLAAAAIAAGVMLG